MSSLCFEAGEHPEWDQVTNLDLHTEVKTTFCRKVLQVLDLRRVTAARSRGQCPVEEGVSECVP